MTPAGSSILEQTRGDQATTVSCSLVSREKLQTSLPMHRTVVGNERKAEHPDVTCIQIEMDEWAPKAQVLEPTHASPD
jgi:hypothetical protein